MTQPSSSTKRGQLTLSTSKPTSSVRSLHFTAEPVPPQMATFQLRAAMPFSTIPHARYRAGSDGLEGLRPGVLGPVSLAGRPTTCNPSRFHAMYSQSTMQAAVDQLGDSHAYHGSGVPARSTRPSTYPRRDPKGSLRERSIPYCRSPWRWRPFLEAPVARQANGPANLRHESR